MLTLNRDDDEGGPIPPSQPDWLPLVFPSQGRYDFTPPADPDISARAAEYRRRWVEGI